MNLVVLISTILFTLFGIYTCAVIPKPSPSPTSNLHKLNNSASDVGQEQGRSLLLKTENKLNEDLDDHAGDHDQNQKVKARKGVTLPEDDNGKVSTPGHTNRNSSTDRANTTITKTNESLTNRTSEISSSLNNNDKATNSDTASSYASDKYSPYESKSSINSSRHDNTSASSNTSKSKSSTKSASTESTSSSKSSSFNKKPLVTYSVEDEPTLLNIPRVRQSMTPLTPLDAKVEAAYLPPSSDFVLDRMQSKREMYIFPLVVLIFLVPMVLGVGIIILRRVRDYMSTRHYRRMDFLVDGMYNT